MACTNFSPALGAAIRPILAKGSHGSRNSAMAIRKPSTAKFDGRPGIQGSAVSNPGEELLALRNLPGVTPYPDWKARRNASRSEEHTSELQSLMRNSYAVFCMKTKINKIKNTT